MKALSVYTTEDELKFDFPKVTENTWAPLTDLQSERTGLVEVFDGVYYTTLIEGYTIFNVRQSKRAAVKAEALENEFNYRVKKLSAQDIQVDMDVLLEEVNVDLTRMSNITTKDYLTVYDHKGKRFIVDAPRGKAEDVIHLMHNLFDESCQFEVLMTNPFLTQPLLTSYVTNQDNIPDPLALEDSIKLGVKCIAGKAPTAANIVIKKEDISSKEVINHITKGKVAHMLGMDWDGIIFFNIDHTFMISGVVYEGDLKYKQDMGIDQQDNFIAEYQQILPEVSKMLDILVSELDK